MKHPYLKRTAAALLAALVLAGCPAAVFAGEPEAPASQAESASVAPAVLMSRGEMTGPLAAGQETELTISFQNLGSVPLRAPVAVFTPSEGLALTGPASSFAMEDIPAGGTGQVKVRVKAADSATADQSLGAELRFGYEADGSEARGTASDRIPVPVSAKKATVQPVVLMSRSAVSSPISPGEEFYLDISFENKGDTAVTGASAAITASEGLSLLNDTSTLAVPDIAPGKSASVKVRLKGAKEITSASQSLSVELRFAYESAGALAQGTASDRINIPAKAAAASSSTTEKPDAPVPNIVIQKFGYGDKTVSAGGKFPLSFTFQNTGSLRCENIVVTVDGGENFTVDGATNTYHYKSLDAGKSQEQEVAMQAVPASKSGAQPISVAFRYEYVDGSKRASVTNEIKVSVPVSQPDRFQISAPNTAISLREGEEGELTLPYVNKGKAEVTNVEAELVGEGFTSPARNQYLGNIAAGASGSIGFAFTPDKAGPLKATVKITYEDADQKVQTREFPVSLTVDEPMPEEDFDIPAEPAPSRGLRPWMLAIPAALAVVLGGGLWLLRRKKQQLPEEGNWTYDDYDQQDGEE